MKNFGLYSKHYDLLNSDKDYKEEANIVSSLILKSGIESGRLLDLGCGTGLHGNELSKLGFQVTGVDLSQEMIDIAKTNFLGNKNIEFQCGNARTIILEKKYNAIISLFHVVSYQKSNSELLAFFVNVEKHLEDDGVFVCDFWYAPGVLSQLPESRVKRVGIDNIYATRIAEPELRCADSTVTVNYSIYIEDEVKNTIDVYKESHTLRYLSKVELDLLLGLSGLELCGLFKNSGTGSPGLADWSAMAMIKKIK